MGVMGVMDGMDFMDGPVDWVDRGQCGLFGRCWENRPDFSGFFGGRCTSGLTGVQLTVVRIPLYIRESSL